MTAGTLRRWDSAVRGDSPRRVVLVDAVLVTLVAGWTAVAVAGTFGFHQVPHLHSLIAALPLALAAAAVLRREEPPAMLVPAAAWSACLAAILLGGPMIVQKPWTYALAVPGAALSALAWARWPAAGVFGALALSGAYNSIIAFTSIPVYPLDDGLMAGLALSVVAMYLAGRRRPSMRATAGMAGVALYVLVTAFEVPLSSTPQIARDAFHVFPWYLLFVLVVAYAPWSRETYLRIAKGVVLVAAVVGGYAVLRWIIGPAANERAEAGISNGSYNFVNGKLVVLGSFATGRSLGVWTSTAAPLCTALALVLRGHWRVIAALAAGLCVAALIGSQMRAGIVGLTLGLVVVVLLHHFARAFPGLRLGVTAALVAALLGFGGVLVARAHDPSAGPRYTRILSPSADPAYQARKLKWNEALDSISRHPWGQGLGTVGSSDVRFGRFQNLGTFDIDNSYLEIAVNQGIAVALLFIASMLALLTWLMRRGAAAARRLDAALAIGAAGSLASFLFVIYTGVYVEGLPALPVWLIVGLGSAALVRSEPPVPSLAEQGRP